MAWQIDYGHSTIEFSARHMMLSKVRGRFQTFTGTVNADEANPANSTVEIQIDAASLETKDERRDGHLRSPDFFNVEQFPYITFKSTKLEQIDESHAKLHGELTIRDVVNPVTLDVEYHGQAKSPWGTTNAGFSATTTISRKDWGLTWNVGLETGGVLVSDEIGISIEIELVKEVEQPQEEAAAVTA